VITAVETTPGSIAENKKLIDLVESSTNATASKRWRRSWVTASMGRRKTSPPVWKRAFVRTWGEIENAASHPSHRKGHFDESHFTYDSARDLYHCPAGQPSGVGPVPPATTHLGT
jgi:hypothetical protein